MIPHLNIRCQLFLTIVKKLAFDDKWAVNVAVANYILEFGIRDIADLSWMKFLSWAIFVPSRDLITEYGPLYRV